jgi:hypothetical protein
MPKVIYIISDMQFDRSTHNSGLTAFENAKQQYEAAGFTLPHIVFWNVSARDTNVPVTKNEGNVTLVSGLSQSTFRYVVEGKTPLQSMLDILNGNRDALVTDLLKLANDYQSKPSTLLAEFEHFLEINRLMPSHKPYIK